MEGHYYDLTAYQEQSQSWHQILWLQGKHCLCVPSIAELCAPLPGEL